MAAPDFIAVYDFETAIEAALYGVFVAEGIADTFYSGSQQDFDRPRPRVELYFSVGSQTGHIRPDATYYRPDAFSGSLTVRIVSNSKPGTDSTAEHSAYRATVRNIMAKARGLLVADAAGDDTLLPYHTINDIVQSGSNPSYEGQEGFFETSLNYDLKFNIRPAAWPGE